MNVVLSAIQFGVSALSHMNGLLAEEKKKETYFCIVTVQKHHFKQNSVSVYPVALKCDDCYT